jgi:TRAP-type mannitol/chloroaromatic compound transport system substrate-binding protein
MLLEYTLRNSEALVALVNEHHVDVRRFPDEVIRELRRLSEQVVNELAEGSEFTRKVYASYRGFLDRSRSWQDISEKAYLNLRSR